MRNRRRWPWLLVLGLVGLVTLWWPAHHASLFWSAVAWRAPPRVMVVPVEGMAVSSLVSTWHAPRSGGRRHEGADLFANRGTPVRSVVRGTVWRIGEDRLGGHVVWVLGEGHTLYYYAHLDSFADGLSVGDTLARGATVGFVGNSGNARTTPPHLHFGMYRIGWSGVRPVDPIPVLKRHARVAQPSGTRPVRPNPKTPA